MARNVDEWCFFNYKSVHVIGEVENAEKKIFFSQNHVDIILILLQVNSQKAIYHECTGATR